MDNYWAAGLVIRNECLNFNYGSVAELKVIAQLTPGSGVKDYDDKNKLSSTTVSAKFEILIFRS